MPDRNIEKTIIHVPKRPQRTVCGSVAHALKGVVLGPLYWLLAAVFPLPGLRFRAWCFALGLRALSGARRSVSLRAIFHLLFMPMESTRYFEFDFARKMLVQCPLQRYLDVSSPRLLPISVLDKCSDVVADLINPNLTDLDETARFVDLIGARDRCRLHHCLLADAPLAAGTYDVITSISVLEHIPEDLMAVQRIWALLKPGGAFLLTVPCMAQATEQYIDRDEWGLLDKDPDGHVFWQRFYDRQMLEQNVFRVTGAPHQVAIYGENVPGTLLRNSAHKRCDPDYPYWREPYMMATEYRYFDRLDELPGEGVIGFLFLKPT